MAPSSSVGSDIFAAVSLLIIALLVLLLIRHYLPLRTTPAYLLVPVFLALALPSSIVLLVPIDLASAESSDTAQSRGIWLPERAVLVTWRITYWLTFCLTWFILPLLGEYCDSGYRDAKSRVIYSFRTNLKYQVIVLATGVAGLVYVTIQNGFRLASVKALVVALAYAWGLILAIGLMGHGLVALPRRIFRSASVRARLRHLQTQAPKVKESLDDAVEKLNELERTVMQLKSYKGGASPQQVLWIDELADTSTLSESRIGATSAVQVRNSSIPTVVTDRYLADLTRKLKRARHKKARFVNEWSNLCHQAQTAQIILDSASSKKLDFGRSRSDGGAPLTRFTILTPSIRYHLHMHIIPYLRIGLSGVLAIASILIVWSEIVQSFAPQLSVIGITVVHHQEPGSDARINFGGQLIAAAWLLYMDCSALYAISDVKVWGNRALVRRQTYAESACWYSLQVAKLTVPLSYNFVTMTPTSVYKETSFYQFLGQLINITPLGAGFSRFFPCFLLLPMVATLFNLYGKTKNVLGFGVLDDESEENPSGFGTGGWREGRALIERELQSGAMLGTVGLASRGEEPDPERVIVGYAPTDPSPQDIPRHAFRDEEIQRADRHFNDTTNHEEAEEDHAPRHFYQDLGERLRNTFDTADRPQWMRNIGSAFKTPKWVRNDHNGSERSSEISRWFGGRQEDGRVRL